MNDDNHRKCQQALSQWYQLWTRWIRGTGERKALVEEWKTLISVNNKQYPFLWVDVSGKVWKDMSFLEDPKCDVDTVDAATLASNLCYGSGATLNQLDTALEEWQIYPLETQQQQQADEQYFRATCLVVQEVHAAGEDIVRVRRRISAIIQCKSSNATIVQLHESLVTDEATSTDNKQDISDRKKATKTNVPSKHRYIAEPSVLDKYSAKPMLAESTSSNDSSSSDLVGLSIQGWNIATSQGPIGDQNWFEEAQHTLEPLAQFKGKGRKLVLPEMVFPLAHVVLEFSGEDVHGDVFMVWDAMDALQEWSRAHQGIPLPDAEKEASDATSVSCRGVSVLESSDASLWKQKQAKCAAAGAGDKDTESIGAIRNTEFHYDWTYSTPFCGSIFVSGQPIKAKHSRWEPLPKSGMPMSLLTDTSVPILYYDQILLYEDDLHDNGAVEYTIKVRVMPHCAYILGRLFLRVDHVLVRLRETRWLIEFASSKAVLPSQNQSKGVTIYRDVTWREAAWKDLGPRHQLPTQVSAWTTDSGTRETQAFQGLLARLPLVDPPKDIPQHSKLVYS